jgi:hypothetical protein
VASKAKKSVPVRNVVVVSDTHGGCGLGLFTLPNMRLDDGGWYCPSKAQNRVAGWWREFWEEFVPTVCRGEPYVIVFNGDAIDGVHHKSVTQWTHNLEVQSEHMYQELSPIVQRAAGYFHLRGTEAHVGASGQEEERLAKRLGAIPDETGNHARWELWLRVGFALVHFSHHISTAGGMAYETSAIHKELEQALVEAGRWNMEIPDVICRSHRHRSAETRIQTYKGFATSFTTAGWQLKTPFVYRVAGARQTQPQIGGTVIRCGDEDCYTRHFLKTVGRPQVCVAQMTEARHVGHDV